MGGELVGWSEVGSLVKFIKDLGFSSQRFLPDSTLASLLGLWEQLDFGFQVRV
jgi:hypothetical protein